MMRDDCSPHSEIAAFSDSEKAIFVAAVLSLVNSAQASILPVVTLVDGLRAVGLSGFGVIVANLQASVSSLSATISNAQVRIKKATNEG